MSLVFKDIYDEVLAYVPDFPAYDALTLINNAVGSLNSKNFVHETEQDLKIDSNGEYDLTGLSTQVIKVVKIVDTNGFVLTKKGSGDEYIKKISSAGETVYSQIGDKIFVNPLVKTQTIAVTFDDSPGAIMRSIGSFVDDGFLVGQNIYIADCDEIVANNQVYKITGLEPLIMFVTPAPTTGGPEGPEDEAEVTLGLSYKTRCYEALPKFTWNSGSPPEIAIKDSFRPAIRFMVLSDVYDVDKYGVKDQARSNEYERKATEEIKVLLQNELQYKELA